MGKNKQPTKEKKFNRNVEISAPILDPEIVKAIHTPPKGLRRDLSNGGFKALLSNLNSQDSTDELQPLNDNHMPSYIGISCAVSGYSNYSHYNNKRPLSNISNNTQSRDRSRTTSPSAAAHQHNAEIHHITIDKSLIKSPDEELKVLTEKLTASVERKQSPSLPAIPPTEDDRHHGAYVGARYCPLPAVSEVVHKHIPLLGIDDDKDPQEAFEEEQNEKKVEHKIANLYGDNFVEDWRESMNHKVKKELPVEESQVESPKNPKDLVTLKPTPVAQASKPEEKVEIDIPTPNVKVLASVEKEFLNKLLTDENPPVPSPPPYYFSPPLSPKSSGIKSDTESPAADSQKINQTKEVQQEKQEPIESHHQEDHNPSGSQPAACDALVDEKTKPDTPSNMQLDEEHIEYEIRAQSPVDNESSPIRCRISPQVDSPSAHETSEELQTKLVDNNQDSGIIQYGQKQELLESDKAKENDLVSFSPEPVLDVERAELGHDCIKEQPERTECSQLKGNSEDLSTTTELSKNGHYYLTLLEEEKSFILEQVQKAEERLAPGTELDEDTVGQVRSVIGKANLLLNKKFNQFSQLCEANLNKKENQQFVTLDDDLAGFWDMLNIQITDVRKSFENMWTASSRNVSTWNNSGNDDVQSGEGEAPNEKHGSNVNVAKSIHKPKLDAQKDQARRERLLDHINQMKLQTQAAAKSAGQAAENLLSDEAVTTETVSDSTVNDQILSAAPILNDTESSPETKAAPDVETEKLLDSTTTTNTQEDTPPPPPSPPCKVEGDEVELVSSGTSADVSSDLVDLSK